LYTYTLTITKDDFWLEFKSKDKHIAEKELGVWITSAVKLLEQTSTQESPEPEIVPEKIELGSIVLDSKVVSLMKNKEDFQAVEKKPVYSYKISDETKEILQKAIHKPLPRMHEMLEPKSQQVEPKKISLAPTPVPVITPALEPEPVIMQEPQDFTTIYNQKIAQENKSTDRFAQLLSQPNIHTKLDCLVACAYHLVKRENFERFTLKQINTLSKALLEEILEHDTLKEALEKRFIKIVPDYTGIATTMEYTLTEQGAQYFKDVIAED